MVKRAKQGGKGSLSKITPVPFKVYSNFNASSSGFTSFVTDLNIANLGARVASFTTLYKKWRLRSLKVKGFIDTYPNCQAGSSLGTTGVSIAAGYYGSNQSNAVAAPALLVDIFSLVQSDIGCQSVQFSVPSKVLHEARNADWIDVTNTGSVPAVDISNGAILAGIQIGQTISLGSVRMYVCLIGVIDFCEPTNPVVQLTEAKEAIGHIKSWGRNEVMALPPNGKPISDAPRVLQDDIDGCVRGDEKVDDLSGDDEPASPGLTAGSWADADETLPNLTVRQVEALLKRMKSNPRRRDKSG